MLSYCLKCEKKTESKNVRVVPTKNGRILFLSNCAACNSKKNQDLSKNKKLVGY